MHHHYTALNNRFINRHAVMFHDNQHINIYMIIYIYIFMCYDLITDSDMEIRL